MRHGSGEGAHAAALIFADAAAEASSSSFSAALFHRISFHASMSLITPPAL